MKKRIIKVGIVVNSLNFGGNERSAINIAMNLPNDFDTTIITQETIMSIPYKGKVISLDLPCRRSFCGKVINSLNRLFRLKKIVRNSNFDCLLIILPISNIINYSNFSCKKIVSCREYGDLTKHIQFYSKMAKRSDLIVFNSKEQQKFFIDNNPTLQKKTRTIYNILDIDGIASKVEEVPDEQFLEFTKGKKTVVSVGRFVEQKAFCHLLKSFRLVVDKEPDARLVMIGDGELRGNIEKMIGELELDNEVLLLGFEKDLHKYIAKSLVFALPSYSEGFPNVLIEALACGTAAVATDCSSGPLEILSPKEDERIQRGYRVSEYGIRTMTFPKDENAWNPKVIMECHKAFSEAIMVLLNNDELRKALEVKGLSRAQYFRKNKVIRQWERLFQ